MAPLRKKQKTHKHTQKNTQSQQPKLSWRLGKLEVWCLVLCWKDTASMICCAWCLKRQAELLANIQKLEDLIFKPAFLSSLKESALGTLSSHPPRDNHLEPESSHPVTAMCPCFLLNHTCPCPGS